MKQMSVLYGIGLALLFAIVVPATTTILSVLIGLWFAQRLTIATGVIAYSVFLVSRSQRRSGRIFTVALIALLETVLTVFEPSFGIFLLGSTFLIWLTRVLLLARGPVHAFADGVLVGAAYILSCSAAAMTHSLALAVWTFFLVIAAGPFIASFFTPKSSVTCSVGVTPSSRFERAYQSAEGAIGALSRR